MCFWTFLAVNVALISVFRSELSIIFIDFLISRELTPFCLRVSSLISDAKIDQNSAA